MALRELHELGVLFATWHAPARHEVHDDPLAVHRGERHLAAVETGAGQRRGRLPQQRALGLLVGGRLPRRQHGDEEDKDHAERDRRPASGVPPRAGDRGVDVNVAQDPTPTGAGGVSAASTSTGAETGAVGRRRRPGHAASTVPKAMTAPPIHSQMISGCTMTPMTAVPPGWSGPAASVRYTSSRRLDFTDGDPMAWVANGNWWTAGA